MTNNFLSPINFGFKLDRTPNVNYTVQRISIPGTNLTSIDIPTPFVRVPLHGNIEYGDLQLTFKVGENLEGYLEIVDWMNALGHPDNFDQYEDLKSDATVGIFNSSRRSNITVKFTDMYPVSIGSLELDTTQTDTNFVTVDVVFKFLRMNFSVD